MKISQLIDRLTELGLSELEALTYVALVRMGPATAYSVGRSIGKPTANVYKAADSLDAKGAIVTAAGESRMLHPVPPAEFLANFARKHAEMIAKISESFRSLSAAPAKCGLFQLESPDAVLERARQMLSRASHIAVIDCFPEGIEKLRTEIEALTKRNVKTFVQVMVPTKIRCSSLSTVYDGEASLQHWRSEQINIATDGREVLLALCTRGLTHVVEAFWSNSLYLSCLQMAGMLKEHTFHQLRCIMKEGNASELKLKRVIDACPMFHNTEIPGQHDLSTRIEAFEDLA